MSDCQPLLEDKYQALIYGYVRQSAVSMKLEIPEDLIEIVSIFFPKLDVWNKKLSDPSLTICNDGNEIQQNKTFGGYWYNAYGTQTVKPLDYLPDEFEVDRYIFKIWRVKFDSLGQHKYIFLGIIPDSKIESVVAEFYFCFQSLGYGLYGANNELYHEPHYLGSEYEKLNVVWKEGETMDIVMYFKKGDDKHCCLGYQTNDNFDDGFVDLDINSTYRFAAAFYDKSSLSFA